MDKADEQPTIAEALKPCPLCKCPAIQWVSGGPGCHYLRCEGCGLSTDDGSRERITELWNTRTTSLAAQDDWTTKRVAELVAEGDGHWRSCTGCHETNEGAETGDYPFNPVFKTYQGGGCGECGGIGVVWDDIYYADYAEFCLNADDDAPSLAAQDGMVEALESAEVILSQYADYLDGISYHELEMHPYIPSVQQTRDDVRKALSAIKEQQHD